MNPASKCAQRLLTALVAIASILFMAACGSNSISISPPPGGGFTDANLNGTYVISISGSDINGSGSFFAIVGTITADGNGHITAGTVDINDVGLGGVFLAQSLTASTYNITPDGRGTGTLATPIGNFGLDFVLTSSSHGLIIRFGATGSGSGTLDLQGSATQSSLTSLAFSLNGADSSLNFLGSVGAFTLNSSGTITSGIQDFNDNGVSAGQTSLALAGSLVLAASGTSGTAQLNTSFGSLAFDVWVIDSTHLKLIETDTTAGAAALSGDAFTQQTTFSAGQLVYTLGGSDSGGLPLVAGGFVMTDASGALTNGLEDYNDAGTTNTQQGFTGLCSTFAAGRCNMVLTGFSNGSLNTFVFAAYPSSGGILLLEIDSLGLLQGAAYNQTATSFAATQGYGLNLSGANFDFNANSWFEVDDIAQFNATASVSNNMTGFLDENDIGLQLLTAQLTGTFTADTPATGRGAINVPSINTFIGTLNLEYYVVNPSTVIFIEGDGNQVGVGVFELQNASVTPTRTAVSMMNPVVRPISRSRGALRHK
jgi:hypothetical protein